MEGGPGKTRFASADEMEEFMARVTANTFGLSIVSERDLFAGLNIFGRNAGNRISLAHWH